MSRLKLGGLGTAVALAALGLVCAAWADDAPTAAEPSPAPGWDNFALDISGMHQSIDGNRRRFEQYVVPPDGVYPGLVSWQLWDPETHRAYLDLVLRDLGEPTPWADMYLVWGDDVVADGRVRRSAFYPDFTPDVPQGAKVDYRFRARSSARPDPRAYWHTAYDHWGLEADDVWRQDRYKADLGFRVGSYDVGVDYRHYDFTFLTDGLYSGASTTTGLSFASRGLANTSVSGAFRVGTVDFDGIGRAYRATEGQVTVTHSLRDNLSLWGRFRRHNITETITINTYAQSHTTTHLEARYNLSPRTRLIGFWEHNHVDYVNNTPAVQYDVPANTLGADLYSRLRRDLTFRALYQRTKTDDRPPYQTVHDGLGPSLLWGTRDHLKLSATYTPVDKPWGLTGEWVRDTWTNDKQMTDNSIKTGTVTAWWQANSRLSLTGTWLRQNFDLPTLDAVTDLPYTTDGSSWVLGGTYQLCPTTSLTATYVIARGLGANENEYKETVLGVTHRAGDHNSFSARAVFNNFDDSADDTLAYDADLYSLSWRLDF